MSSTTDNSSVLSRISFSFIANEEFTKILKPKCLEKVFDLWKLVDKLINMIRKLTVRKSNEMWELYEKIMQSYLKQVKPQVNIPKEISTPLYEIIKQKKLDPRPIIQVN